jgi:hypothetical protein
MATNKSTLGALDSFSRQLSQIISVLRRGLNLHNSKLDELAAWNRLLREHLRAQRAQKGKFATDRYRYNQSTKEIERLRGGQVVSSI